MVDDSREGYLFFFTMLATDPVGYSSFSRALLGIADKCPPDRLQGLMVLQIQQEWLYSLK
jgi:hypothetical protein